LKEILTGLLNFNKSRSYEEYVQLDILVNRTASSIGKPNEWDSQWNWTASGIGQPVGLNNRQNRIAYNIGQPVKSAS